MPRPILVLVLLHVLVLDVPSASAAPARRKPPASQSPDQGGEASLPPRLRQRKQRMATDASMVAHTGESRPSRPRGSPSTPTGPPRRSAS